MKKITYPKLIAIIILFSIANASIFAMVPDDGKKSLVVSIDGIRMSIEKDSLSISAKGKLTMHAFSRGVQDSEQLSFRIVIRHRNYANKVLIFPWDEAYSPEKRINSVELEKILLKTKPGDQLIIMPLDQGDPLIVNIARDNC